MFTGDVHLGPAYHDPHVFHVDIQNAFRQHHFVLLNVEGPITSSPPQLPSRLTVYSAPGSHAVFKSFGNCVFDLANNHMFDHGAAGARDTINFARNHGWPCLGAGENIDEASRPCILKHDNISVGILAVCDHGVFARDSSPGIFGNVPESRIRTRILELKQRVLWVVVVYHGGEEFTHVPMPSRRRLLMRYLEYGADVIVAHHAHCVQRFEQFGDKLIFYGLGNFVFDLPIHQHIEGTDESVLLSLSFSDRSISFNPLFTWQNRNLCKVVPSDSNQHFSPISSISYAREWEIDAGRLLALLWDLRRIGLTGNGFKRKYCYILKCLRRFAGLLWRLKDWNNRPIIIYGFFHHLKSLLFFRSRNV
ncbi:MAG: CapA family protein [Pirellulales bacterium]|nr:CapA family protein [Pirellulales bacterium]